MYKALEIFTITDVRLPC